jgi:hypothetical protein
MLGLRNVRRQTKTVTRKTTHSNKKIVSMYILGAIVTKAGQMPVIAREERICKQGR